MTTKIRSWKRSRRKAAALAGVSAIALLPAGPAFAQETTAQQDEGDTIYVTGSRLVRSDLSAPSPTTVVDEEALELSGDPTIEAVLYEFPQLSGGVTSSVNSGGGSGVLEANLRSLGATRTLVLVNGRRFIPANGDGTVDLATIPGGLTERVEIITGGASAVYGSDAIAGAVNFILEDDYEGFSAGVRYGETGEGDGSSQVYELQYGAQTASGRGNAVVYASYTNRNPVFFDDREFSSISLSEQDGELVPFGSSNIPGTRIALSSAQIAALDGVDLSTDNCTNLQGVRFGEGGGVLSYCQPEDGYNFAALNYLLRPMERGQIVGIANFDVTDRTEAYTELYFVDTRNAYQQAEESFALATPGLEGGGVLVPNYANNPILFDPVRQFLIDNADLFDPDGDGDAQILSTGRRGIETGPRFYDYSRLAYNATAGLRGDFDTGSLNWRWDLFGQFQRSRTDSAFEGQYVDAYLSAGLDVVVDDETGEVRCRSSIPGCVPVNPFGFDSITEEAGNFIAGTFTSREIFERHIVGGSVTSVLADLPAGELPLAVGFEYREDDYSFDPGALYALENNPTLATEGGFDVSEVFAETRVPILAGRPFADVLAVEAAIRYSDYSTSGGATTWKVNGEWGPVPWLRFRSAYNEALRAPTANELFSPIGIGFSAGDDLCDADFSPTPAQQDLCVAQGVPAGDISSFQQINVGFDAQSGGNPALEPEESETFTVGAVIQPPMIDRLNITVDYFDISVDNAIANLGAQQTVNACFESLDINSAACQSINRLGNGQIDYVETNLQNIGAITVNGLDVQADYNIPLPSSVSLTGEGADLGLTAVAGWIFERVNEVEGASPQDCAGYFGGGCTSFSQYAVPDFKATFGANYTSGPMLVRAQWRVIGDLELYPDANSALPTADRRHYVDLAATYNFNDTFQVYGGVDNIFDEDPPLLGFSFGGDANTDVTLYDVIGRRWFIGLRATY
ncbi:TonB-dependent receptor plug domain-containing protein [Parvularcula oceani]|uniref:TonB-dependent receptor plug domain-containing protein n=1 Tax=Parvularcula oceani TaxID=1247963 RepID=UPI0009DE4AE5|nr:TonB-dependent receptor [Parvularcula oceani]